MSAAESHYFVAMGMLGTAHEPVNDLSICKTCIGDLRDRVVGRLGQAVNDHHDHVAAHNAILGAKDAIDEILVVVRGQLK